MAISDTITSMYENVGNVYDVLELAGADLTNVDKNIFNLKQQWQERLLYFLANGTDVIWNNWLPKLTGSGETITLNNTIEAKMDIVYKGNTSQFSTTGNQLVDFSNMTVPSSTTYTFNNDVLNITSTTGQYKGAYINILNLIKNNPGKILKFVCDSYDFSNTGGVDETAVVQLSYVRNSENRYQPLFKKNGTSFTYTIPNDTSDITTFNFYVYTNNTSTSGEYSTIITKPMLQFGTESKAYEPYTNGPAPNPSYPYPVNVVTGNNTINVVGKNLFDGIYVKLFTSGGSPYNCSYDNNVRSAIVKVKPNTTYTISKELSNRFRIGQYDEIPVLNLPSIKFNMVGDTLTNYTITTENKTEYLLIQLSNNNEEPLTQVELGNIVSEYEPYQSASYPINLGNIELCKIGDYQDYIRKSTGKNLFDKNSPNIIQNKYINSSGVETSDNSFSISDYIKVDANTVYSSQPFENKGACICFYNNSKNFLSSIALNQVDPNFTTPNNCKYIRLSIWKADINIIQIEKGQTATPYEPYGKVWYIHKDIGKIVLNGSENWGLQSINSYGIANFYIKRTELMTTISNIISNRFINQKTSISNTTTSGIYNNVEYIYIRLDSNIVSTTTDFKTWLGNNNVVAYYILSTPTTTEITDSTLISQLEAIKKSYNNQTNISQTNADKPFILDVSSLTQLS